MVPAVTRPSEQRPAPTTWTRLALPAAECLVVVVAWECLVLALGAGGPLIGYDSFRDIATALGIQRGEAGLDPMLAGYRAWYPPGLPALFVALATMTGVNVPELYGQGALILGWWNPLLLFLLVRQAWGRSVAWVSLACVCFGSRWCLTHAVVPMASVQAVGPMLATLAAWHHAAREGGRRVALAGVLLALTFWCHPLCAGVALLAVLLHAGAGFLVRRTPAWRTLAVRAGILGACGGVLAAPLLVSQWSLARTNTAPYLWFAPELLQPEFAWQAGTPLVWPFGLLGLGIALREGRALGWLPAWWAVGVGASVLGYLGHAGWSPLPWVIPHEFQWHGQLAFGIAAALGITTTARRLARGALVSGLLALALALAMVGPAMPRWRDARSFCLEIGPDWRPMIRAAEWLSRHAGPGAVLAADPDPAYYIAALAGCRVVAVSPSHMNPAADPAPLLRDLETLLTTDRESTFVGVARPRGVRFLLATNARVPQSALSRRYVNWSSLTPVLQSDSLAVLYRFDAP